MDPKDERTAGEPAGERGRPAGRRGGAPRRRRGPALEQAILDAAWRVLTEHGYEGFTYEAVAARAHTSRPVLYRRWPQREDLLLATLTRFWQPIEVPDTGNLRDDALGFLRNAHAGRAHMMTLMSVQLADYFRTTGTGFGALREALLPRGGASAFEIITSRAVARGELPDVPRPPRLVNLPFDLLRHDLLLTTRPVSGDSLTQIVDELWLPLLGAPAGPSSPGSTG